MRVRAGVTGCPEEALITGTGSSSAAASARVEKNKKRSFTHWHRRQVGPLLHECMFNSITFHEHYSSSRSVLPRTCILNNCFFEIYNVNIKRIMCSNLTWVSEGA